jgi:LAO/AO transport system kinase
VTGSTLTQVKQLVKGVLKGDRRSIAKTITLIENNQPETQKVISLLYPHTGKAHIIGVTGPTGSGKSTLIEKLIKELRRSEKTVGVVAVDPTSPFTGGAFLGDRVRMQDLSTDEGVFIRSMATRGSLGGLAKATKDAVKVLDASNKDVLIVETVGAGQTEVDIIKVAHTVVVVLAPGFGDDIQAIKAGIMEIGDIFVINKADRENVNRAVIDVEAMLEMNQKKKDWRPPVVKTTAITGEGIPELVEKINQHRSYLKGGLLHKQHLQRIESELEEAIKLKITETVLNDLKGTSKFNEFLRKILEKEMDPNSAAEALLQKKLKKTARESQ